MKFKASNNFLLFGVFFTLAFFVESKEGFASTSTNVLGRYIEDWLDPALNSRKTEIIEIIDKLKTEEIPTALKLGAVKVTSEIGKDETSHSILAEKWGFAFAPDNFFDYMLLSNIQGVKRENDPEKRIAVADLGCGFGKLSLLMIFAGAKVDMVDLMYETIRIANKNVYKTIAPIFGCNKSNANEYYRACRATILEAKGKWVEAKHDIIVCNNVAHFFNEEECAKCAQIAFENLYYGGLLFVSTDTPFMSQARLSFYEERRKKGNLFPGYGVYSRKIIRNDSQDMKSNLDFAPAEALASSALKGGAHYKGFYHEGGVITDEDDYYHIVKNNFLINELSSLFIRAGFKLEKKFYLNSAGKIVEEEEPLIIGNIYKACAILAKPHPH